MALALPQNHICFAITRDINDICNTWLKSHGIDYFNFGRMFDDGSCYLLTNRNEVNQYLFNTENRIFSPVPLDLIKNNFSYLVPSDGPYQKVMHDVHVFFDLGHAYDLFICRNGYIDAYCFSSSAKNEQVVNFYLNNSELLKKFVCYFEEKISHLLKKLEKNRFILKKSMKLNFKSTDVLKNNKKFSIQSHSELQNNNNTSYFYKKKIKKVLWTRRENDVLRLLILGKTAKQIANVLHISHRTVEEHLANLRKKLNCNNRAQLIEIAINYETLKLPHSIFT